MRVVVTGAGGFLGRHLVRELASRGAETVAVDRAEADVCDAAAVADLVARARPDAVVHLAAQSRVAHSFADPGETFRVNVLGTVAVLEAVRRHAPRARILVASSAEVYGAVGADALPVAESAPLAPVNPYGASKVAAEAAALQFHRAHGLDVAILRAFNAVGPGQATDFALPGFAAQLAAIARGAAEPVLRVGNLDAERDLTDVRDVARAYALALERGESGGVYNVCSGTAVPIRRALEALVAASGLEVRVEVDPSRLRPVDVPCVYGSPRRLAAATGWRPEVPLERTIADLYAERAAAQN
jgi:GDP-4-dehydro-6-deoxy-D-mannose reductase